MSGLLARFPPRPVVPSWPATEAPRSEMVGRLLAPPFALPCPLSQSNCRLGVLAVVSWLQARPGGTCQARWSASGAEQQADWRALASAPAGPTPAAQGLAKLLPRLTSGLCWSARTRSGPASAGCWPRPGPATTSPVKWPGPGTPPRSTTRRTKPAPLPVRSGAWCATGPRRRRLRALRLPRSGGPAPPELPAAGLARGAGQGAGAVPARRATKDRSAPGAL
jgi:hypothetical protein